MAERLRTRSAALLGSLWDACGMTGREPVVLRRKLSRDLSDSMNGSPMATGSGDLGRSVDLHEVERGGGQMQLAGGVVQAAA